MNDNIKEDSLFMGGSISADKQISPDTFTVFLCDEHWDVWKGHKTPILYPSVQKCYLCPKENTQPAFTYDTIE